jgi:hypothetical protein
VSSNSYGCPLIPLPLIPSANSPKSRTDNTFYNSGFTIDPIPVGGAIINESQHMFFDKNNRLIITYQKSDENGNMQPYATRLEGSEWKQHVLTDWNKPVLFSGRGSMEFIGISLSGLTQVEPSILTMTYRHKDYGNGRLFIDGKTLQSLHRILEVIPELPPQLNYVQSSFGNMDIQRSNDKGSSVEENVRYIIQ